MTANHIAAIRWLTIATIANAIGVLVIAATVILSQ